MRRRRLLGLGALVVLLALVFLACNYGPMRRHAEAQARYTEASAKVTALQAKNQSLQQQVAKLGQAGYVAGLARQELTYAAAGEDLYIVTDGGQQTTTTTQAATGSSDGVQSKPGVLERILRGIGSIF